jgi:hypothetical protein
MVSIYGARRNFLDVSLEAGMSHTLPASRACEIGLQSCLSDCFTCILPGMKTLNVPSSSGDEPLLQLAAGGYTQGLGVVLLYCLSAQLIRLPICIRLSLTDLVMDYRLAVLAQLIYGSVLLWDDRENGSILRDLCIHVVTLNVLGPQLYLSAKL